MPCFYWLFLGKTKQQNHRNQKIKGWKFLFDLTPCFSGPFLRQKLKRKRNVFSIRPVTRSAVLDWLFLSHLKSGSVCNMYVLIKGLCGSTSWTLQCTMYMARCTLSVPNSGFLYKLMSQIISGEYLCWNLVCVSQILRRKCFSFKKRCQLPRFKNLECVALNYIPARILI